MNKYLSGSYKVKTDIGKVRMTNEDRATALINTRGNMLFLVCDGMGGQNKGDYAASLGMSVIADAFQSKKRFFGKFDAVRWLNKVIRQANTTIYDEGLKEARYKGMGSTLTALLLFPDFYVVAQIGDSRAYIVDNGNLLQITEDQSFVNYLYRTGKITKDQMATHPQRHILMNGLGIYPTVEIEIHFAPYNNETILLCSDGLTNNLKENEILSILKGNDSVEQKANELITLANSNGGSDNIAVIVWEANK